MWEKLHRGLLDATELKIKDLQNQVNDLRLVLRALVQDLSPQLGGDLDVNGFQITSVGHEIYIKAPNGYGITLYNNQYSNSVVIGSDGSITLEATNGKYVLIDGGIDLFSHPLLGMLTEVTDVMGSRALDTIYQNTTGYPILVTMTLVCEPLEGVACLIGASSPPATTAAYILNGNNASAITVPASFIVPINYYYELEAVSTPSFGYWVETRIGG